MGHPVEGFDSKGLQCTDEGPPLASALQHF
jgi:hypothetical protein